MCFCHVLVAGRTDHTGWTAERDATASTLTAALQSPAPAAVSRVGLVSSTVLVVKARAEAHTQ